MPVPGYVTCFHGIVTIEPSVLWERSHKFDIPRAIRVERMVRGWLDVLDPGKSREGRVLRRMKGFARRFGITCEIWTKTRIRTKVFFLICSIRWSFDRSWMCFVWRLSDLVFFSLYILQLYSFIFNKGCDI